MKHCVFHQREETCGDPIVHKGAVPGGGKGDDGYLESGCVQVHPGVRVYITRVVSGCVQVHPGVRVYITRGVSVLRGMLRGMEKVNTFLP